jgi:uncharacterized RDD family membrane protein YckC
VEKWAIVALYTVAFFIWAAYFVSFERSKAQSTIGKRLMGLKVVDIKGERISLKQAMFRYLLYWVATDFVHVAAYFVNFKALILVWYLIWLLPIFFTKKSTTLYDIFSKTEVVNSQYLAAQ